MKRTSSRVDASQMRISPSEDDAASSPPFWLKWTERARPVSPSSVPSGAPVCPFQSRMKPSLAAVAKKLPEVDPESRVLTFCYDTGERYLSIEELFTESVTVIGGVPCFSALSSRFRIRRLSNAGSPATVTGVPSSVQSS